MQPPTSPLRYDPSIETPEKDEAETGRKLVETFRTISKTTLKDTGRGLRAVHAKSHGQIKATLEVLGGLPAPLAQGLFENPASYDAIMRFSTSPGDILPDSVSTPRGVGLKILGVRGEKVEGDGTSEQDFLMVNGPAFLTPTGKQFLGSIKLLAATTDRVEFLKRALSAVLFNIERGLETIGIQSAMLRSLGGHPHTHPLGETFFTQAPVRYGDYIAKLSLAPATPELHALKEKKVALASQPTALRDAVVTFLRSHDTAWDLRAQLCTDLASMPVEDSSREWPQDKSPYVTVARLTAKAQDAWAPEMVAQVDDCLSFSPWHALAAHRPLGSIMRLRRAVYASSSQFRQRANGCPMHDGR